MTRTNPRWCNKGCGRKVEWKGITYPERRGIFQCNTCGQQYMKSDRNHITPITKQQLRNHKYPAFKGKT